MSRPPSWVVRASESCWDLQREQDAFNLYIYEQVIARCSIPMAPTLQLQAIRFARPANWENMTAAQLRDLLNEFFGPDYVSTSIERN